jgi:FAD-dependent urate hydroxylase
MKRPQQALVIGGGIAGPAAAIALQKAGIEAVIYEAHPSPAAGVGSFLTLATNGIAALRTLGGAERATTVGFPTTAMVFWSGSGRRLGEAQVSITLTDGTTGRTLKRADLYRVMLEEANRRGIRCEPGKRLVTAVETPGGVRAVFADGSEAAGDLLIGADGVHSTVRTLIDPDAPAPRYARLVNLGGFVRGVAVDADPGTYHMIFGKRAFFSYALAPDGEVWWFANLPEPREPSREALRGTSSEEWGRRLVEAFSGDAGPAVRLVEATSHALEATVFHTLPSLPRWHSERMIVIGDAAHAPSPSSGQGASLSIEDAVQLGKSLRDQSDTTGALAAVESVRRQRVEPIVRAAARVNNDKAATGAARVLRDAMLPLFLRLMTNSRQARRLYGYRVDWETPDVVPSVSAG